MIYSEGVTGLMPMMGRCSCPLSLRSSVTLLWLENLVCIILTFQVHSFCCNAGYLRSTGASLERRCCALAGGWRALSAAVHPAADSQPSVLADSVHRSTRCYPERRAGPPAIAGLARLSHTCQCALCSAAGTRCTHTENQSVSISKCPTFWQFLLLCNPFIC